MSGLLTLQTKNNNHMGGIFKKFNFRPIMRHTRDEAVVEELSEAEFTHHVDIAVEVFFPVFPGVLRQGSYLNIDIFNINLYI